jgi:E3 SUMO-protein ligase PIAS1
VNLSQDIVDRLKNDSSLRVMLYCAAEPLPHGNMHKSDVNFPAQLEIKVNGAHEVKHNFKGLKNKPGSTLPAPITGYLKKQASPFINTISVTYALTQKVRNPFLTH